MKNKLIAMVLVSTLIGGYKVTASALENVNQSNCNNVQNTCFKQNDSNKDGTFCTNGRCYNLQDAMQQLLSRFCLSNGNNYNANNQGRILGLNQTANQNSNCNVQNNGAQYQTQTGNNTQNNGNATNTNTKLSVKDNTSNSNSNSKPSKNHVSQGKQETNVNKETPSTEETNVNDKFMSQVENKIFEKVNEERSKAGLQALSRNNTMNKYARIKSQDMGDKHYFNHIDLQGNYITAAMARDGVRYNSWGENIAYISGVSDANALANQFMRNWMNSPGHRANILSSNYASMGVGVYKSGNTVYATQEFFR